MFKTFNINLMLHLNDIVGALTTQIFVGKILPVSTNLSMLWSFFKILLHFHEFSD